MGTKEKKITLELNEHEASQLLALIKREMKQVERVWQPYWRRQAQKIEQSIENAYSRPVGRSAISLDGNPRPSKCGRK